ncbi:hypothetical protein PCE1_004375 [Barthelona sp. PCE]
MSESQPKAQFIRPKNLMVTISGIRGVPGRNLTPPTITRYVWAYAKVIDRPNKKIIVGRDSRITGPYVKDLVVSTLIAAGCEVIDCDIISTPGVQIQVQQHNAGGGIVITSSHNPKNMNGLKFIGSDGLFLDPQLCTRLYDMAENHLDEVVNDEDNVMGTYTRQPAADITHRTLINELPFIDRDMIRAKNFKVAIDTANGAGGPIYKMMLHNFNCEVKSINFEPNGEFAHNPEPTPAHLTDLCELVKAEGCDVGFAADPDVDRCVVVDETGVCVMEEYTLALALKLMITNGYDKPFVKNMSSSGITNVLCEKAGITVHESPVGEIQVAKKMEAVGSWFGGEGNGGVMARDLHIGRDAPLALSMVLMLMTLEDKPLSSIIAEMPVANMDKQKVNVNDPTETMEKFEALVESGHFENCQVIGGDGIKLIFPEKSFWVHVRKSNTEPIVRVIGEIVSMPNDPVEETQATLQREMKSFVELVSEL